MLYFPQPRRDETENQRSWKDRSYLSVNRKGWLPILRRNHSTDSVLLAKWCDMANICLGILELLLGGIKGRGLL